MAKKEAAKKRVNLGNAPKEIVVQKEKSKIGCFSVIATILKALFITLLAISLFIYWDINSNKSVYTNEVKIQLEKVGLLDSTLHVVEFSHDSLERAKKFFTHDVNPVFEKFTKSVVYYSTNGWKSLKDYTFTTWKSTENFRNSLSKSSIKAKDYAQEGFANLTNKLIELFYAIINKLCEVYKLIIDYLSLLVNTVEKDLLGWKDGHSKKVFNDALNYIFSIFKDLFQWYHQLF